MTRRGSGSAADGLVVLVPLLTLVASNTLGLSPLSTVITVIVVSTTAAPLYVLAAATKERRSGGG